MKLRVSGLIIIPVGKIVRQTLALSFCLAVPNHGLIEAKKPKRNEGAKEKKEERERTNWKPTDNVLVAPNWLTVEETFEWNCYSLNKKCGKSNSIPYLKLRQARNYKSQHPNSVVGPR